MLLFPLPLPSSRPSMKMNRDWELSSDGPAGVLDNWRPCCIINRVSSARWAVVTDNSELRAWGP